MTFGMKIFTPSGLVATDDLRSNQLVEKINDTETTDNYSGTVSVTEPGMSDSNCYVFVVPNDGLSTPTIASFSGTNIDYEDNHFPGINDSSKDFTFYVMRYK